MQRYFSSIYWHFVGSPEGLDWHRVRKPADILSQGVQPKSAERCAEIAEAILESRTLRARCTESLGDGVQTRPFCCVTDIPLKDLSTHSRYYGTVAIGFAPHVIHQSFLPVFYYPSSRIPRVDSGYAGRPVSRWLESAPDRLQALRSVDASLGRNPFADYLKITDFSPNEDESFYREREWRHPGSDFHFEPDAVAAIVAPTPQLVRLRAWIEASRAYDSTVNLLSWEFVERV